jgi:hypothetical protein
MRMFLEGMSAEEVLAISELVHPNAKKALRNVIIQSNKAKAVMESSLDAGLQWELKRRCKKILQDFYEDSSDGK